MRKKLKLEIENVQVESFDTVPAEAGRGTVRGQITAAESCEVVTDCTCRTYCQCTGQWTCPDNPLGTCDGGSTCYGTCHTGACACY